MDQALLLVSSLSNSLKDNPNALLRPTISRVDDKNGDQHAFDLIPQTFTVQLRFALNIKEMATTHQRLHEIQDLIRSDSPAGTHPQTSGHSGMYGEGSLDGGLSGVGYLLPSIEQLLVRASRLITVLHKDDAK
ncbi:hypothetical protein VNI00_014770 [Paramarasmius palmivorus]|uniref:Uncharacterized protein n=1 Tax=Paramarasmius palmivorus TaxID=297713 RepID=A0AAW0BS17_9AGAR